MFYEAEGAYSSFLRYFCVQHRPLHVIVGKPDDRPSRNGEYSTQIWLVFGGTVIRLIDDDMKWSVLNTNSEHKNTSEMKSTHRQLHKTSKIIEKVQLSTNATKLSQFEEKKYPKSYNFVWT